MRGEAGYPFLFVKDHKRSGYDQKSPLKGPVASLFSGLPGFFHSRPVSTGGDENQNAIVQTCLRRATTIKLLKQGSHVTSA
jgi:hypothetical protein